MQDTITATVPRDRSRQAAAHVFEVLREEIVALALVPGTALSRPALMQRFGVSSTPIRDALLRLQEEGLVVVFPQHTTIVSLIDLDRARQALFLRRAIETEVVRTLAAAPDPALIGRLRGIIEQQTFAAAHNDLAHFWNLDLSFHACMYEAAAVAELWAMIRRQNGHIDRLRHLHLPIEGKAAQVIRDHTAIVDAIAAQDPAQAEAQTRDHLSKSMAFSPTMRQQHPTYFQ